MLRSRGVYTPKEREAGTISKHLANVVNSTSFPDWDKNDRDYLTALSFIKQNSPEVIKNEIFRRA